MRSTVPLHEFMPYGAPELLESRRRHMTRALVLASALALALCAATGGVLSLRPDPAVETHEVVFDIGAWDLSPPLQAPPPPLARRAVERATRTDATAVPVRDERAPVQDVPLAGGARVEDAGPGTDAGIAPDGAGTSGTVVETLPARGDYVYVESIPAPRHEVKPEYPEIALRAGVEGLVTVFVLVGRDGRVLDAVVSERAQVPMLNDAALAAARRWVFTPGLANGHPVACWTAIPFRFRLH